MLLFTNRLAPGPAFCLSCPLSLLISKSFQVFSFSFDSSTRLYLTLASPGLALIIDYFLVPRAQAHSETKLISFWCFLQNRTLTPATGWSHHNGTHYLRPGFLCHHVRDRIQVDRTEEVKRGRAERHTQWLDSGCGYKGYLCIP